MDESTAQLIRFVEQSDRKQIRDQIELWLGSIEDIISVNRIVLRKRNGLVAYWAGSPFGPLGTVLYRKMYICGEHSYASFPFGGVYCRPDYDHYYNKKTDVNFRFGTLSREHREARLLILFELGRLYFQIVNLRQKAPRCLDHTERKSMGDMLTQLEDELEKKKNEVADLFFAEIKAERQYETIKIAGDWHTTLEPEAVAAIERAHQASANLMEATEALLAHGSGLSAEKVSFRQSMIARLCLWYLRRIVLPDRDTTISTSYPAIVAQTEETSPEQAISPEKIHV